MLKYSTILLELAMSAPPRVVGVRQTCSAATLLRRSGASRSRRVLSTRLGVARVATASTIKAPEVALDSAALAAAGAPHFEGANTVFVEEFRIRGNEAGPEQRANIVTIANLLQVRGSGTAARSCARRWLVAPHPPTHPHTNALTRPPSTPLPRHFVGGGR